MYALYFLPLLLAADPSPDQLKLLRTFRDEFVHITPGEGKFPASFEMGRKEGGRNDERPVHKVAFDYSFDIAKYEVPQNLWEAVMGSNPSKWKGKRNSVEMLSFDEAQEFCTKATEMMRAAELIDEKQSIRLPTEAEWEYCARAGTTTIYSFGDDPKDLGDYAWSTENAAGNDPPVGAKKPNPWGLYDMHGYLWEWCLDNYSSTYEKTPRDGSAMRLESKTNILRSGSWKDPASELTSSSRRSDRPGLRDDAVGLRCVLE